VPSSYPSRTSPPPRPGIIHRLARRWLPALLLLLTVLALLTRLTVRDTRVWSAVFFYLGSWPVLFLAWPLLGGWCRKTRGAVPTAVVGLGVTLAAWLAAPAPPPLAPAGLPEGPARQIIFWNIGHPKVFPSQVHGLIDQYLPDLVVLAESEKIPIDERDGFTRRHPAYQLLRLHGGMIAIVRGTMVPGENLSLPHFNYGQRVTLQFTGHAAQWTLVAADLSPTPMTPRTERTERIRQFAGTGPRTLVIGDFNTPYESAAFDTWRGAWHHGLRQAPQSPGAATWPVGLPVLAIDHIWMSRDLLPLSAVKATPLPFDHAWQLIRIQATNPTGA
jgi:hypothetical protein